MPVVNRNCFHADESYVNPLTREFQIVRITEGESGYVPVSEHPDLEFAKSTAKAMNAEHGLTEQDVIDIQTSSMRVHFAEHPVSDEDPDLRIIVTTMDGTVIDRIDTCKGDLLAEIERHPSGLLSDINTNLL